MTGRFEYNHEEGFKPYIYDVGDNRMMWNLECITELLNKLHEENEELKQRISELELLNDGLNYALKYIKKIDVEIDVGDVE